MAALVSLGGLARMGGVRLRGDWAGWRRGRRQAELGLVGRVVLEEKLA